MKYLAILFIFISVVVYATNCGRGLMDIYFDRIWSYENLNSGRTFFTPMHRDIRRQNHLRDVTKDLTRRAKNEDLPHDSGRA